MWHPNVPIRYRQSQETRNHSFYLHFAVNGLFSRSGNGNGNRWSSCSTFRCFLYKPSTVSFECLWSNRTAVCSKQSIFKYITAILFIRISLKNLGNHKWNEEGENHSYFPYIEKGRHGFHFRADESIRTNSRPSISLYSANRGFFIAPGYPYYDYFQIRAHERRTKVKREAGNSLWNRWTAQACPAICCLSRIKPKVEPGKPTSSSVVSVISLFPSLQTIFPELA